MGPGCPVCVTDAPEIDAAVALALHGVRVLTYGDMLRVAGSTTSLDDARANGARVEVIYAATQAVEIARRTKEPVVFFATGFETTAVATAAILLADPRRRLGRRHHGPVIVRDLEKIQMVRRGQARCVISVQ